MLQATHFSILHMYLYNVSAWSQMITINNNNKQWPPHPTPSPSSVFLPKKRLIGSIGIKNGNEFIFLHSIEIIIVCNQFCLLIHFFLRTIYMSKCRYVSSFLLFIGVLSTPCSSDQGGRRADWFIIMSGIIMSGIIMAGIIMSGIIILFAGCGINVNCD